MFLNNNKKIHSHIDFSSRLLCSTADLNLKVCQSLNGSQRPIGSMPKAKLQVPIKPEELSKDPQ